MSARMRARLHDGTTAIIWPIQMGPWAWQGIDQQGMPHLWLKEGHWRENRTPHLLDIADIRELQTEATKA